MARENIESTDNSLKSRFHLDMSFTSLYRKVIVAARRFSDEQVIVFGMVAGGPPMAYPAMDFVSKSHSLL